MRTISIPLVLGIALTLIILGAVLLRHERREPGWVLMLTGYAVTGGLAFAYLTGRFGPERPWYEAPSFYAAAGVLLAGAILWLRRPAPSLVRFGLPLLCIAVMGGAITLKRALGSAAPLAMSMPTLSHPAPVLTYFGTDGELHALSDLKGRVVLLNFWATWCTPCRREMPMLSKLQNAHAADGLVVLYVSLEEPPVLAEFLRTNRFDGVQGRLAQAAPFYNAGKFYPLSYLISRDGRVEKRWSGRPSEAWIDSAIREELKPAS
jgi:cytochrome c biogenesis protein CcmG, thiol:disulfide interchange protein DsbE